MMQNRSQKLFALALVGFFFASLTPVAHATWKSHHPRRAEVLHRDHREHNRLQADKGHLGGHYKQLNREDRAIHHQEHREAVRNGGYLTKGQKRHLNREENHLSRQIKHDHT